MTNILKKRSYIIIITLLIIMNLFQFVKASNYMEVNDGEFKRSLTELMVSIEDIESKKHNKIFDMAALASATAKAKYLYISTSFYNKNKTLYEALNTLNNNLTNMINVEDVINENDLTVLIPVIEELKNNPLDERISGEFYYLVRKYTVIGSILN